LHWVIPLYIGAIITSATITVVNTSAITNSVSRHTLKQTCILVGFIGACGSGLYLPLNLREQFMGLPPKWLSNMGWRGLDTLHSRGTNWMAHLPSLFRIRRIFCAGVSELLALVWLNIFPNIYAIHLGSNTLFVSFPCFGA
jgi:hypothetical protein